MRFFTKSKQSKTSQVKTFLSRRLSFTPPTSEEEEFYGLDFTTTPESVQVTKPHQSRRKSVISMLITNPLRHTSSCSVLESEYQQCTEQYSQTRAKALAETARRLQQNAHSGSPVTPSSVSTGRTLPCFPEEEEYESSDNSSPLGRRDSGRRSVQTLVGKRAARPISLIIGSECLKEEPTTQARLQEYEQRLFKMHCQYTEMMEKLELKARQDYEYTRKLEQELVQLKQQRVDWQSGRLMEFMEEYKKESGRLREETRVAQEWVVTLAELVVGPKRREQTWDEWLGRCLETLQQQSR